MNAQEREHIETAIVNWLREDDGYNPAWVIAAEMDKQGVCDLTDDQMRRFLRDMWKRGKLIRFRNLLKHNKVYYAAEDPNDTL